jgi:hypothetical protein
MTIDSEEFLGPYLPGHVMPGDDYAVHSEWAHCFCQPVRASWKEIREIYGFDLPVKDESEIIIFHKRMKEFPQ